MSDFGVLFGCSIALLAEIVTLVKVLVGSRHSFVITILAMLIAANVLFLVDEVVYMYML